MFGTQELTDLQLRKQTLLLESDLNRLALYVECERLGRVGNWVNRLTSVRNAIGPWARLLSPAAVAVMALGLRRRTGWFGTLTKTVESIRPLIEFWRARVAPSRKKQV